MARHLTGATLLLALGACGQIPGSIESRANAVPVADTVVRPGPSLLYEAAPAAPQLENIAPWTAEPILVSGASAYRDGEFLYQDYLFDDRGAAGVQDPADPMLLSGAFLFSPKAGTLTYPSDAAYANNAADLVELRVRPLDDATAFRVTLNTLIDPARVGFTIALGSSEQAVTWPHGAKVSSPAQWFLTVHGEQAELIDAASGQPVATACCTVAVDLERRQFDVRVSHTAWNPGAGILRMAAGVGLWDRAIQAYLAPTATASATAPGGAAARGAALFNLAFRYQESLPDFRILGAAVTIADAAAAAAVESKWWREYDQAAALASGDISAFFADVDFSKLQAGVRDDSAVPASGPLNRIYASRFSFGQGIDYNKTCGRFPQTCEGVLAGQLQTYQLYVPSQAPLPTGWGLTLLLHAHSGNHNIYLGSQYQAQFGDRASGSLVLTPGARGPDGDYIDIAEADVFEAWADVARHYPVDSRWVALSGYSMGGGATYKLAGRWPDLFGRAMAAAAIPFEEEGSRLPPLRNVPLMTWVGYADEGILGKIDGAIAEIQQAGLRFTADVFQTADHLTIFTNNEWGPAAEFLGEHHIDSDPPAITYILDPRWDSARAQTVADHAYWISGLQLRDTAAGATGRIDIRSEAFGVGEETVLDTITSQGFLQGGTHGPMSYQRTAQDWAPVTAAATADRLHIQASNIGTLVVDVQRARLSCAPDLKVSSDGPLEIRLQGCDTSIQIP